MSRCRCRCWLVGSIDVPNSRTAVAQDNLDEFDARSSDAAYARSRPGVHRKASEHPINSRNDGALIEGFRDPSESPDGPPSSYWRELNGSEAAARQCRLLADSGSPVKRR